MSDRLLTITLSVDRDGNIFDDTQTHGNSFADVYRGFLALREELDRQIADRKKCPFNPKYGKGEASFSGRGVDFD